jgi:hypothetical protein
VHLIPEQEETLHRVGKRAPGLRRRHERDVAARRREHPLERVHERRAHLSDLVHLDDAEDREAAFVQPVGREVGRPLDDLRLGGAPGERRHEGTSRGCQNEIEPAAPGGA